MVMSVVSSGIDVSTSKIGSVGSAKDAAISASDDRYSFASLMHDVGDSSNASTSDTVNAELNSTDSHTASAEQSATARAESDEENSEHEDEDRTAQSEVADELLALLGTASPTPLPVRDAVVQDPQLDAEFIAMTTQAQRSAVGQNSVPGPEQGMEGLGLTQHADDATTQVLNQFQTMLDQALGSRVVQKDSKDLLSAKSGFNDVINMLGAAPMQAPNSPVYSDSGTPLITPRFQLHEHVGTQAWASELGNKLTLMASKESQSATLYMTPADLGPVQVKIEMNKHDASVWFTAEHAQTRSALEQALPRLRELFSAQGMMLSDAGVFGERSRQQPAPAKYTAGAYSGEVGMHEGFDDDMPIMHTMSLSMLDAYA